MGVRKNQRVLAWAFALWTLPLGACGGCEDPAADNSISAARSGNLLVSPQKVTWPQVRVGTSQDQEVILRNTADGRLTIFSIALRQGEEGSIEDISILDLPPFPLVIEPGGEASITLRYAPSSTKQAKGELVIGSSDPKFTPQTPRIVEVEALPNRPIFQAIPEQVLFPPQSVSAPPRFLTLQATNRGSAPLELERVPEYGGDPDFSILPEPRTYPLILKPYDAQAALTTPQDYILNLQVRYRAIEAKQSQGGVTFFFKDAQGDSQRERIPVGTASEGPCLDIDGLARNLGQVPVGRSVRDRVVIENCSQTFPVTITDIRLTENSQDREFFLDLRGLDANSDGAFDGEVVLQPGQSLPYDLVYEPLAEGSDLARVVIFSDSVATPEREVVTTARGAVGQCPVAQALGRIRGLGSAGSPSLRAAPLDTIILDGGGSMDPDGVVPKMAANWTWTVLQKPDDAVVNLKPLASAPEDPSQREVRLFLAGEYRFGLEVRDNEGFQSCEKAEVIVRAIPQEKILVELTWTNPSDEDESDASGADVDLHMVKMGPGRWFEAPYDVYYGNPSQNTMGHWEPESPSLDIDDLDGLGPENIQMNDPAPCQWYAIGVHYFAENNYGTAFATVRVYLEGSEGPVYERLNVPLQGNGEFWDVARLHWPSKTIVSADTILPVAPENMPPAITPGMMTTGLCTGEMLY